MLSMEFLRNVLGLPAAKTRCAAGRKSRRLFLESLEDRRLLAADVWDQRGGDAGHTSYVDTSFDPTTLGEVWSQTLGYTQSGTGSWRERAVAIDDAHVYRTALEGYAPSGLYHVIAYDVQDGSEVWRRTLLGRAFEGVGEPSVAGGIVYVNRAGHSGISGGTSTDLPRLYGFDATDGSVVLNRTYEAQWGSNERPVIEGNQLIVEDGYYGGISAYTASTLSKQWFRGRSAAYNPPFAALNDTYAFAFGSEVYQRSDGTKLPNITHPQGYSTIANPIVSDSGRVLYNINGYVNGATRNGIAAFDGNTHAHLWTINTLVQPRQKAVGNGMVAITDSSSLLILDEADGSQIMTWQGPSGLGEVILTKSHAIVQSSSSGRASVHAIDLSTGQDVWQFEFRTSGSAVMEMALTDTHLVLSHHQFVKAFEIGAANRPPEAIDDAATTDEDIAVVVDVLANDSDPDRDAISVTAIGAASHGAASLNPDGTITYTPDADYNGSDSFTYTIGDGNGNSAPATVDVTVDPVNDDPEVLDAVFSLAENSAAGTSVGTVDASDVDGDDLSFALSGTDAAPFAIDALSGAISVVDASALDFETKSQFDFTVDVSDGNGGQASANVRVNLTNVLEVEIDVLPADPGNQVPLRSKEIEVAILSNADLDPFTMLDLSTVRLRAPGSATSAGVSLHRKHGYRFEQRDVNGDGVLDMVLKFKTADTGLQAGDTSLQLEGTLLPEHGGESFVVEQAITTVNGNGKVGGKGKNK